MARYRLTQAIYSDAPGVGKVRAGKVICTNPAEMQPGDVLWINAPANLPITGVTITGSDSVDG
jgi:hypothetical protein